jgi:hypothetical protein
MSLMVDIFCLVWSIVGIEAAYMGYHVLKEVCSCGCGSKD